MPVKRAQGGPTDGQPFIVGNGDPELLVATTEAANVQTIAGHIPVTPHLAAEANELRDALRTATTCTHAANCSAASGRWKRATDLAGNATTVTTPDGGMWNRACLATGCPVRTYI